MLNSKKKAVTVLPEEALALVVLGCKRAVHGELRKLRMVNIGRINCTTRRTVGRGGPGVPRVLGLPHRLCHPQLGRHGRIRRGPRGRIVRGCVRPDLAPAVRCRAHRGPTPAPPCPKDVGPRSQNSRPQRRGLTPSV
jgi:hypothetical protein